MAVLFSFLSFAPGPFWLILMVAPRHPTAMRCFDAFLLLLSLTFSAIAIPEVPRLLPVLAAPAWETLYPFLSSPKGVLGSWNHMILADLWIGRWVVHDALRHGVPAWIRLPILFLILFFGPLGFCVYGIYRLVVLRRFALVGEEGTIPSGAARTSCQTK